MTTLLVFAIVVPLLAVVSRFDLYDRLRARALTASADRGGVSLQTVLIVLGIIVLSIVIIRWVDVSIRD